MLSDRERQALDDVQRRFLTEDPTLTLLTASRDPAISEAVVLAELLEERPRRPITADRADC